MADEVLPLEGSLVVVTIATMAFAVCRPVRSFESLGHAHVASLAGGIEAWSRLIDPAVPRYS